MKVLLANPRGFCAGVDRAIAIVEQALAKFGAPIYVRHEVVHNRFVVDDLKAKGAVFVEGLDEVPAGSTVVFSAHGVSKAVRAEAAARGLTVFDATCPLVTKVHSEVAKMRDQGREIVMIGHAGHPEVEGTMGQCDGGIHLVDSVADVEGLSIPDSVPLAYVTQTTLSVDDAAAIGASWVPSGTTSVMRRRTGRMRSRRWRRWRTWSSSSAARTARTRTGCARSRRIAACPLT
jgi:4-hydroxy-3-methylbut-2-enyl diphosphate reductase